MPWARWADQGLPQWVLDATNVGIAAADCAPPLPDVDPQEWAAAVHYWRTVLPAIAGPQPFSVDDGQRDTPTKEQPVGAGGLVFPGVREGQDPHVPVIEHLHRLKDLVRAIRTQVVRDAVVNQLGHNKLLALHGLVTRYVGRGFLAVRDQLQRKAGTRQSDGLTRPAVGESDPQGDH